MSVVDVINEQDQKKIHTRKFLLWPQKWAAYDLPDPFDWEIHPFQPDQIKNIPSEPGIYSFVIQPVIASHSHCSYLMYIGQTERTLQIRFKEYLRDRNNPNCRPKILELLNRYKDYLHFCFSIIEEKERIIEIESALINAFRPPCNDRVPAETSEPKEAFQ